MKIKLSASYIVAFLALLFIMHEAHEIVHTSIGRIICGCWGMRDFNVWGLCEGCSEAKSYALISTFAGPIFTFIMIWIGAIILKNNQDVHKKSFGFSLLFANMPFARILTASMGSGDEVWGLNQILHNHTLSWVIGLSFILLVTFYPLIIAYRSIQNNKKIGWFLLFFIVPVVIDLLFVLGVLNSILQQGVLDQYWILGSPMLVSVWTMFVIFVFLLFRKKINLLGTK